MNMAGDVGQVGDASATSLNLGARSEANFFNGLLYDVRFYATALDANALQYIREISQRKKGTLIRFY